MATLDLSRSITSKSSNTVFSVKALDAFRREALSTQQDRSGKPRNLTDFQKGHLRRIEQALQKLSTGINEEGLPLSDTRARSAEATLGNSINQIRELTSTRIGKEREAVKASKIPIAASGVDVRSLFRKAPIVTSDKLKAGDVVAPDFFKDPGFYQITEVSPKGTKVKAKAFIEDGFSKVGELTTSKRVPKKTRKEPTTFKVLGPEFVAEIKRRGFGPQDAKKEIGKTTPQGLTKSQAQTIFSSRSKRSQAADGARESKTVAPSTAKTEKDKRLQDQWKRDPSRSDFAGVDTKRKGIGSRRRM